LKRLLLFLLLMTSCSTSILDCLWGEEPLLHQVEIDCQETETPGAIVGIFRSEGTPEFFHAIGFQDDAKQQPMQPSLRMRVASLSKLFLGNAVLILAGEQKFRLDEPISRYVEGIPSGDLITIRMLGQQTSGLPNGIENKNFQAAVIESPMRSWKDHELLGYALELEPNNKAGERWRYSNSNSIVLGMLIERVTGKPYQEAIDELLIQPLDLRNTGFAERELPSPSPRSYRFGYPEKVLGYGDKWYDVTGYGAGWTGAAGSMYSTAQDLAVALPRLTSGDCLNDQMKKELLDWQATPRPGTTYGFHLGQLDGWVGHTGDVPGFGAVAIYHPVRKKSVIALTNLSNAKDKSMPAERLANILKLSVESEP
jgi:D-alanyl-D-alanine carboxypeptidase